MPFPMVHFFVAHELAITQNANDISQFYLGILAPDAYHSRKKLSLEDRNVSHLTVDDTAHWQKNTIRFMEQYKYDVQKWFYIGYGIHILTDICWDIMIYKPFLLAYSQDKGTTYNQREAYMSDMTGIDLWLYRNCEFKDDLWTYLSQGKSFDVQGLVTAAEIDGERDLTLGWYDRKKDQAIDNFSYITPKQVIDFIKKAIEDIDNQLSPIVYEV